MPEDSRAAGQPISTDPVGGAALIHPWDRLDRRDDEGRLMIASGRGIYVTDTDGREYIDGPGGMWCVQVGHGQDRIGQAMAAQASRLAYSSPWYVSQAPETELATRLASWAPGDLNHVFFTTGGSTAVDSALRFALFRNNVRGRPDKKLIVSRADAYHGSTHLSASVSGKPRDRNHMEAEPDRVRFLSSPNPYRRPAGVGEAEFLDGLVDEFQALIDREGADRIAAFIAEPILASGGVIVPPAGYHRRFLDLCRANDILYISDEVVTGFGRLGHWFASRERFGIVPDIITFAKGVTSGYAPLGGMMVSDRLIEDFAHIGKRAIFSHGFTYSGHPVCCAAALANLAILEEERVLDHVRSLAPYFQERLAGLRDIPIVGDVRGLGLMACVECVIAGDVEIGARIDRACQKRGLIVRPLDNMCVMSPPLIINREQIDRMVAILRDGILEAMDEVRSEGLWKD